MGNGGPAGRQLDLGRGMNGTAVGVRALNETNPKKKRSAGGGRRTYIRCTDRLEGLGSDRNGGVRATMLSARQRAYIR